MFLPGCRRDGLTWGGGRWAPELRDASDDDEPDLPPSFAFPPPLPSPTPDMDLFSSSARFKMRLFPLGPMLEAGGNLCSKQGS